MERIAAEQQQLGMLLQRRYGINTPEDTN